MKKREGGDRRWSLEPSGGISGGEGTDGGGRDVGRAIFAAPGRKEAKRGLRNRSMGEEEEAQSLFVHFECDGRAGASGVPRSQGWSAGDGWSEEIGSGELFVGALFLLVVLLPLLVARRPTTPGGAGGGCPGWGWFRCMSVTFVQVGDTIAKESPAIVFGDKTCNSLTKATKMV